MTDLKGVLVRVKLRGQPQKLLLDGQVVVGNGEDLVQKYIFIYNIYIYIYISTREK